MAQERLCIPEERVAILIGRAGSVRKRLEKATATAISIERSSHEILIEGEPLDVLAASRIIKAIGRGFNPAAALQLRDEEMELRVISLGNESKATIQRLMGRVIGRRGGCRRNIEEKAGVRVSVYGKTVSIIGRPGAVEAAARCVETLLEGKTHAYAYSMLERASG
jgi:ribosomal RNA assembly protein